MHTPAEMRHWLTVNGYEVGQRGRLRPEHIAAYNQAHGLETTATAPAAPPKPPRAARPQTASPAPAPGRGPSTMGTLPEAPRVTPEPAPEAPQVPEGDLLTDERITRAREAGAALVRIGNALIQYKEREIPSDGKILLDFRS